MTTCSGAATNNGRRAHFFGAVIALSVAATVITACIAGSGGPDLTIVNGRSIEISVFWIDPEGQEDLTEQLGPGEHITFPTLKYEGLDKHVARDENGQFIAARCYTWEELEAADWTIVFGATDPVPGSAGSCERELT